MPTTYRTKQGDVLDLVVLRAYGSMSMLTKVFEANRGLCERGPILPQGLTITLPDATVAIAKAPAQKLWD